MTKPELVEAAAASEVDGLYKLVSHWDALTNEQRFKLAWEALDKLGGRQPTPDDIEMARVIQLARDRGLAGIPSAPPIHLGPAGADGRHPSDELRRVIANAPPRICDVCRATEGVHVLTLQSSNGLNVVHRLCTTDLNRWSFAAGELIPLLQRNGGLDPVPKR